jgi:hypothetical protein
MTLIVACLSVVSAQQTETRSGATAGSELSTSASRAISIQSGTRLEAELLSTVDVRKAAVGDGVVLKTKEAIKSKGRTVVNKGAKLVGRITEVTRKTNSNAHSSVSILFDTLQNGTLTYPISATISSITNSRARLADEEFRAQSDTQTSSNARSSGGGGLVGGVTSTVGSTVNSSTTAVGTVLNTTTAATNSVVNATGNVAGSSTGAVSDSLRGIQISESANASASGTSVLSLAGKDLRLEKGTSFTLVLNQSAKTEISKQP